MLRRAAPVPGYTIVIWNGGHVTEPHDLDAADSSGYWQDVLAVARALDIHFTPAKMNFLTLGNALPHLHTHVFPRYVTDPAPERPLPWDLIDDAGELDEAMCRDQLRSLRQIMAHTP